MQTLVLHMCIYIYKFVSVIFILFCRLSMENGHVFVLGRHSNDASTTFIYHQSVIIYYQSDLHLSLSHWLKSSRILGRKTQMFSKTTEVYQST